MKKALILSMMAVVALSATAALGQGQDQRQRPAAPSAEGITARMTEQLSLTADQQAQVKALNEKYADLWKRPPRRPGRGQQGGPQRSGCCGQQNFQGADSTACLPPPSKAPKAKQAPKGDRGKQFAEQRQAYDKELKQILTDDQYKTWQQSRPQRRGPRGPRPQQQAKQD